MKYNYPPAPGSEITLAGMSSFDQCRYHEIPDMDSTEWMVQNKNSGDEISIVRKNNPHGRLSYGWFGPDKIFVSARHHGDSAPPELIAKILILAQEYCDELNAKEL